MATPTATPAVLVRDGPPDYRPFPDEARRNLLQELVEVPAMVWALGLPRGGRVLEVGCGRGVALPVLHRLLAPRRLVGIDVDVALLAEASARLQHRRVPGELYEMDVRRLSFPRASLDVVIDFGTLYHIAQPERGLAEIARVLASGGVFAEETPVSQLLSHPVRAFGRVVPWRVADSLVPHRTALLWATRVRG